MKYYNTNFEKTLGINVDSIIMSNDEIDKIFYSLEKFKTAQDGETNGNLYLKFLAINEYVTKILKDCYEKGAKYNKRFLQQINYYCEMMIKHSDNEYCLLNLDFGLDSKHLKMFYGNDYKFLRDKIIQKKKEFECLREKYFNDSVLLDNEYNTLMNIYQALLDNNKLSDENVDKLTEKMVNKKKMNVIEKRLFYSLLAYQDINNKKLETAFAVSDYNMENEKFNVTNDGISSLNKILINFNSVKHMKRSNIAHTIYHEITHRLQYEKTLSSDLDFSSFEFIKFSLFNKYPKIINDNDYYHRNYFSNLKNSMRMHRIEIEADQIGYQKVAELLDKYCKIPLRDNLVEKQIEKSEKAAFIDNIGLRSNNIYSEVLVERIEIPAIVKIIKEHPEELNNFPGLRKIFDQNGKIKSMVSLVSEIAKDNGIIVSSKTKSPIFDFIRYGISSNVLNNIDVNNLSRNEQFDFFRGLDTFVAVETKKIKELMKTEDKNLLSDPGFRKNLIEEIRRMKKLEQFVNNSKVKRNYASGSSLRVQKEIEILKDFYNDSLKNKSFFCLEEDYNNNSINDSGEVKSK